MQKILTGATIGAATLTAAVVMASPATAATVPAYEPDANSLGSLTFYDAAGTRVTSGNNLSHLFDYAVASSDAERPGTTKATLLFGIPDHTKSDSAGWSNATAASSKSFPVTDAAAPASIKAAGSRRPVATVGATEGDLASPLQVTTLDQTDGYKNLIQVRLKDSGPGSVNGQQDSFWSTDIAFDTTTGTWTQVYPAVATATSTSTSLTVSPTSPADNATVETLTATVTPSGAAGTVTFKDGAAAIGSPVSVTAGTASTKVTLGAGAHSITAVFTPTDSGAYTTSTSDAVSYTVNPPTTATTTSLAADLVSPQLPTAQITFTATVAPASASGDVEFRDANTVLGTRPLGGGAASLKTSLAKGSHSVTAVFVPADTTKTGTSTSPALTYVIATAPAEPSAVTASAQNTTATVTWTAPADDGGTPITGYDVQFSTDGVNWQVGAPQSRTSTATSQVVTGLTNGVGYQFRVRAINGVPTGASSYTPTGAKVVPVADATSVTVGAPRTVRNAAPTTLSVTLANARDGSRVVGVPVSLYRRSAGQAAFAPVATVTTSVSGTAAYRVVLGSTSQFQWRFAGNARQNPAAGPVSTVAVSPVVSISATPKRLKHGKKAKVYGTASPAPSGERASLQRLLKGKWRTVATTTVKRQKLPNGRTRVGYVFSTKLGKKGSYVFRVTTAPTVYSLAGVSGRVTVRAT